MARHVLHYHPCTSGVAIGTAHVLTSASESPNTTWIIDTAVTTEQQRITQAINDAVAQVTNIRDKLCRFQGSEHRNILDAHIALLQDPSLTESIHRMIATRMINAEWALDKVVQSYAQSLGSAATSPYIRERQHDVYQLGQRIMRNLMGTPERTVRQAPYPATILFAPDLSPAEAATLPRRRIRGFVTAHGGSTSHTAIIARSLEYPAIVGAQDIFSHVHEGDSIIIDADQGQILIAPNESESQRYKKQQQQDAKERRALLQERELPAVTIDGFEVKLSANIELLEEIPCALDHGAEGIGMYRTEYLFMHRDDLPSEEEQYQQYRHAIEGMAPHPVTIRTLDLGGDKIAATTSAYANASDALGIRGIRLCLHEPALFHTQLRALYRASIHGQLRILFPMITGVQELHDIRQCIERAWESLRADQLPFDDQVPLGIMIEVPSAVMLADQLAQEIDFFSIGTNDLTQYTLAVDRANAHVSHLYHSLHPAVLRMIDHTIRAAQRRRIPVSLCGEMAGDPLCIIPLLGLELSQLSMNSVSIPRVKRLLRQCTIQEARQLAAQALQLTTPAEIEQLVRTRLEL